MAAVVDKVSSIFEHYSDELVENSPSNPKITPDQILTLKKLCNANPNSDPNADTEQGYGLFFCPLDTITKNTILALLPYYLKSHHVLIINPSRKSCSEIEKALSPGKFVGSLLEERGILSCSQLAPSCRVKSTQFVDGKMSAFAHPMVYLELSAKDRITPECISLIEPGNFDLVIVNECQLFTSRIFWKDLLSHFVSSRIVFVHSRNNQIQSTARRKSLTTRKRNRATQNLPSAENQRKKTKNTE